MSQENLEVVQALVAASQRGDWEAAIDNYDPRVELDMARMPDGEIHSGRDAVWDFYRRWFGTWERLTITPEQFIDAGESVVVVVVRIAGVGRRSGVETSMRAADVMTLRGGKVIRQVGYPDASEALEALGLPE
jgi:ketosteroid isomerase-like protein